VDLDLDCNSRFSIAAERKITESRLNDIRRKKNAIRKLLDADEPIGNGPRC
jgi:hypothetical protein